MSYLTNAKTPTFSNELTASEKNVKMRYCFLPIILNQHIKIFLQ